MIKQRDFVARLAPFLLFLSLLALDAGLTSLLNQLHLNSKISYLLRAFFALVLLVYYWRDYIELKSLPQLSDFFYASIAGAIVFIIWIFPYPGWLSGEDTKGFDPFLGESKNAGLMWLSIRMMGAVLVVPIMEELFWRSMVMRWFDQENFLALSPERISGYAYVGSACLFAIQHHLWLAGLFAGMVYGELYKTYKNLWVPIFAHATTNLLLAIWVVSTGQWGYW